MQLQNIMGETDQRPPALDFSQGYRRVELPLFEQDSGQPVFLCAPQTRYGLRRSRYAAARSRCSGTLMPRAWRSIRLVAVEGSSAAQ